MKSQFLITLFSQDTEKTATLVSGNGTGQYYARLTGLGQILTFVGLNFLI